MRTVRVPVRLRAWMALLVLIAAGVLLAACDERYLSITITAEYDSLESGALITYTITITAVDTDGSVTTDVEATPSPDTTFLAGPSSSEWNDEVGVIPTDEAFSLNAAAADPTKVLKLVVRVNKPLTEDVTLDAKLITIQVDEDDGTRTIAVRNDDDDDNNEASLTIEMVIPIIDVGVTTEVASGEPGNPQPGDFITYQHLVTNHRDRAVETTLTNIVPAGTTFEPGTPSDGSDPA